MKQIDIMLISETHFTSKSHFVMPGYTLYHTMHPDGKAHGGSAILIKSKIKHYQSVSFRTNHIQAVSVVVDNKLNNLTVTALYCPPRHTIKEEDFNRFFLDLGCRFIAGGDYNAKHTVWGSRITLPRGRELWKCIQSLKMQVISSGEPTYWPTDRAKIPDLIDFCVAKGISKNSISCLSCNDLSSDHSPILIELYVKSEDKPKKCVLHNKNTNWALFRELINISLKDTLPLKTELDIDKAVERFNISTQEAAWKSTPTSKKRDPKLYVASHILDKISEKRRLRKQWQSSRCPHTKSKLNSITRELKHILKQDRNKYFQSHLLGLNAKASSNYSLWKATRKLNQPVVISPPLRKPDGDWARTDREKAQTFAQHLSSVFTPHPNEGSMAHEKEVINLVDCSELKAGPIERFTKREIRGTIMNMDPRKAPGYDLITIKLLQELPNIGMAYLTSIFNAMIRLHYFPPQWKVAQIIMLQKPDKPLEEAKSYRPISLLPIVSKLFESLLLKRMLHFIRERHLIPDHQFGFRHKHATIDQVHRLTKEIVKSFEAKQYCAAAFLDISQAFDRVWHEGLLYKIKTTLPYGFFLILKSYLKERHFLVTVGDATTNLHPIKAGVPQGSVLGPILYLLYTSDLPTSTSVTTGTFADDTAILASHSDPKIASELLQEGLNDISDWLKKWRIKANESKSVNVIFTLRRDACPPVMLNNVTVPQSDHVRYLGIHLDKRLTWQKHIFTKRKQLGLQLRKLYWLLGRQSQVTLENKVLLYKAILKPIWAYGIQLWGTASHSNIEIIQRFQNKILRLITNAPWFVPNELIHNDLKIPPVKDEIVNYTKTYRDRIINHPNLMARNLMEDAGLPRRLKLRTPQDILKQ
jgi:hypothetical protein